MKNGRCKMHGGMSLVGLASPQWKTGRYSKYIPNRLVETYSQSLSDEEILVLRDDIALVDSRIQDLLKRVDSGESGDAWQSAKAAQRDLVAALKSGDQTGMADGLRELDRVIARGLADYAAWGEIAHLLDQRERLVRSERRRLVELQQMISTEQALTLMTAVVALVKEHVSDRTALFAISNGIRQLANANSGPFGSTGE